MKTLFIYYSYTGNGTVVADYLKNSGVEVRPIIRKKPLPKSFFWSVMTGGFLAGVKAKDKINEFDEDISQFDHIIIGSPIWNARLSSPINTVLSKLDLSNKKITFLLYSGSGEASKAEKRIHKEHQEAEIIILKEPKKYPEELEKLSSLK